MTIVEYLLLKNHIEINIEKPFIELADEDWLNGVVEVTLKAEKYTQPVEISLLVTSDEVVQSLNINYRGIDKTTDVLAFALHADGNDLIFPQPDECVLSLGEVIISFPQASRQALANGKSVKRELAMLTIHGVLHLLGYDHQDLKDEQVMRARESAIMNVLT